MLKNFEPNKVFSLTSKAPKYILLIFIIVISIGLLEALIFSPEDYIQSHSVRIMYVHVPSAWISLGTFSVIAILSFSIIIFKIKSFVLIAKSLAPAGLVFNIIALVTGSIWGKPTWGTWWAWDARITSMLLLSIFYLLFITSWKITTDTSKAEKISSIIAIIGLINIPVLGDMAPWQLAFIIVGLPGILLALLVYLRKEPERPIDHNPSGNLKEGIGDALKFFAKKKWVYASFILPASVMTTIAYSQAWVPAMFERTWGMDAATYAYINGLLLLAFGPISNND